MTAEWAGMATALWADSSQACDTTFVVDDADGGSPTVLSESLAPSRSWQRIAKRTIDLVVGSALCLVTLVLVLGLMEVARPSRSRRDHCSNKLGSAGTAGYFA